MSAHTLYDYLPSGNGYKIRLVLNHLGLPYRRVEMDIKQGATRAPEFLAKNPNGRIPVLEVAGLGFLAESHAIMDYLGNGTSLIPSDAWARAQMWHWLCFEQYHIEPNIGTARFWLTMLNKTPRELGERLTEKLAKSHEALEVLEQSLTGKTFITAETFTLADIGVYAYTHVAPEAGISLDPYPAIRTWLGRVAAQPGHTLITDA